MSVKTQMCSGGHSLVMDPGNCLKASVTLCRHSYSFCLTEPERLKLMSSMDLSAMLPEEAPTKVATKQSVAGAPADQQAVGKASGT